MERRLLMCWVPLSATAQSQYTFVHLELFPSTVTAVVIPVLSSHIQSITRNLHRISRHGFLNRCPVISVVYLDGHVWRSFGYALQQRVELREFASEQHLSE